MGIHAIILFTYIDYLPYSPYSTELCNNIFTDQTALVHIGNVCMCDSDNEVKLL